MHAAAVQLLCVLVAQLLRRVPEAVVVSVKQEVGAFCLPSGRPVEAPMALGPVQRAAGVSGGPVTGGRGRRLLVCWRGGGTCSWLALMRQRVMKAADCGSCGRA